MRVLFLNQTLGDPGGAEVFNSNLLNKLAEEKKIDLSVTSNNSLFLDLLDSNNISQIQIPYVVDIVGNWKGLVKAPLYLPLLFLNYLKIIKNNDYDIIFMSGYIEKIIASPIASFFKIPVIWIEFGPLSPLFSKFFGLPQVLYSLVKGIPQTIVVPSKNTLKHLKQELSMETSEFTYIQCGRNITKKYKHKRKSQQIVCISRLEKGKGQDLLLRAFKKVLKKHPQATLVLVGTGDFKPDLMTLADKLQLNNKVKFLGRVPDALKVLSESEVAVFPSVWNLEGFGMVLTEALYVGTPVVAYDHGPGNEIISHKENGLLAKSASVHDLANKINQLLSSKTLQKKLVEKGKKDFKQKYDIKKITKKYLSLFQVWR